MKGAAALLILAIWAGSAAAQDSSARRDLAVLLARGDSAWAQENRRLAFAAYDAVVKADSVFSTQALFRLGLLHGWANRFGPAAAALRRYVVAEPDDLDGRVALGRTHAWASQYTAALAQYDTVLARTDGYRDAVLGRAQALAWSDRIPEGEAALTRWLERHADDAEAWALLGQFRRWRGEPRAAEEALARALALAPGNASAREQMAWVRADINPALNWQLVGARDSERNTLWHREFTALFSTTSGLRYGVSARVREASVTNGIALVIPGAVAHATWRPRALGVTWRGEFGVVAFPEPVTDSPSRLRGGLRGTGLIAGRLRLSAGGSREPFDEILGTASRGLMLTVLDVDAAYRLTPRLQLALAGATGVVDGDPSVHNSRITALGALRFTPRRGTQLALSQRAVSWEAPQFGVFFAPQTWSTTELLLSSERAAELGLVLGGDLALASQAVAFDGSAVERSAAPRAAMRIGWRTSPGREVVFGLVYANVAGAGATTASDYRYGAATLTGRWTF